MGYIDNIDDRFIERALDYKSKKPLVLKIAAVAACICITAVALAVIKPEKEHEAQTGSTASATHTATPYITQQATPVPQGTTQAPTKHYTQNGLLYKIQDNECTILGIGTNTDEHLIIPSTVEGVPVTVISGDKNDWNDNNIIELTVSETVTVIKESMLAACNNLRSVQVASGNPAYRTVDNCLIHIESKTLVKGNAQSIIPTDGSVTKIGGYSFENCTDLTSIVIPEGVLFIGTGAFSECVNLQNVTWPDSLQVISDRAFYNCEKLQSVTCKYVQEIQFMAFYGCKQLKSFTIPATCTRYRGGAFAYCADDFTLSVEPGNPNVYVKDNFVIVKFEWDKRTYVCGCLKKQKTLVLPQDENIVGVYSGAFAGDNVLTSVTIPSNYKYIDYIAFSGCENLVEVNLSEGLLQIEMAAFSGDISLQSITLPHSLEFMESAAFCGCINLKHLAILCDAVPYEDIEFDMAMGNDYYLRCNNIQCLEIGQGVAQLGYLNIYDVSHITHLIIAENVTYINPLYIKPLLPYLRQVTVREGNTHFAVKDNALVNLDTGEILASLPQA